MSRSDLQALAKELGITANLKSAVIIEEILQQRVAREHDIFREFKKEFDVLSREHLLALDRMARKATQALFALAPDADEAVTMKRFKKMRVLDLTKCCEDAQKTMTKAYEAELSLLALAKAELQGKTAEATALQGKTAEAAAPAVKPRPAPPSQMASLSRAIPQLVMYLFSWVIFQGR